ncbi:hypothetical protein ACN267_31085 [Micromonospora sp. WMMD734]|uniref:hypothetical protein n=1 Tax=Micromonospora sp. WMMD734 TaxID=3404129 RepID=UPI003B9294DC
MVKPARRSCWAGQAGPPILLGWSGRPADPAGLVRPARWSDLVGLVDGSLV